MRLPAVAQEMTSDVPTWVVPFASVADSQGAWHTPADAWEACPHLQRLFRWPCVWTFHQGDEDSLTPPHEWAKAWQSGWVDNLPAQLPHAAQALSLDVTDGALPWAASEMAHLLPTPHTPAAWFVPCHHEVGMDHIRLHPPEHLALSETHSRALMHALQPWAAEDGIALHWVAPTRWLATGAPLTGLCCPSLDRVIGRSMAPWLAAARISPSLRRLQSEAQMLFYTHAAHDERVNHGALPVNAFWIEGNGVLRASDLAAPARRSVWTQVDALRVPAQQGDVPAWQQAWAKMDTSLGVHWLACLEAEQQPVSVWLAGERGLLALTFYPLTPWQRLQYKIKTLFASQRSSFNLSLL